LKPGNVLLRDFNDLSSICLTDFTTTFVRPSRASDLLESTAPLDHPMMQTLVGTPFYLAGEIVQGGGYSEKVDLYALGCLTFQMAFGKTPYEGSGSFAELYARIASNDWTFPDARGSGLFRDFVRKLLSSDPDKRPSAFEALAHPWLAVGLPQRPSLKRMLSGMPVVFSAETGELRPAPGRSSMHDEMDEDMDFFAHVGGCEIEIQVEAA
jgi:serine/threonine protein kinase